MITDLIQDLKRIQKTRTNRFELKICRNACLVARKIGRRISEADKRAQSLISLPIWRMTSSAFSVCFNLLSHSNDPNGS